MYPLAAISSAALTSIAIAIALSLSPDLYSFSGVVVPIFVAVAVTSLLLGFVLGRALLLPSIVAECLVLIIGWLSTLLYATQAYLQNSVLALAAGFAIASVSYLTGSRLRSSLNSTKRHQVN